MGSATNEGQTNVRAKENVVFHTYMTKQLFDLDDRELHNRL